MKYHLIGIKGSGMSALACLLSDLGHEVSGSDITDSVFTDISLNNHGIYSKEFNIVNLEGIDLVIIGNAFNESNIEVKHVFDNDIKYLRYFDFIDGFAQDYFSCAIAGTNGKTTTTGIVASMLRDENMSYLIGDGNGFGKKDSDIFIFEACEYKETFMHYHPDVAIINNIEMDHPDFFKDLDHVVDVFNRFANQSKLVILNGDDKNCLKIKHDNIKTFGLNENCDLRLINLNKSSMGYSFEIIYQNNNLGEFELNFVGLHMVYNALASILFGLVKNLDINVIMKNINLFEGAKRRFEIDVLDSDNNVVLIDDYAHHPTAIDLVVDAIRQRYKDYTLTILFQPHTYSRTIEFLDEFAISLAKADELYLAEIFGSARESVSDIDINILKNQMQKHQKSVHSDIDFIKDIKQNHVIALLGAGNIDQLYKQKIIEMFRR